MSQIQTLRGAADSLRAAITRSVTGRHRGLSSVRETDVSISRVHFEHKADLLSRSNAGIDLPEVDRREKTKNRSWGVAFVEVRSNERTACRASGRTAGHCSVGSPCDFKAVLFSTQCQCSVQLGRCPEDCKESSCYTQCLCLVGIDGIHH
ncbi:hypothetical protein T12_1035 [Trichinella patagoniensis]|uniref:Uncharacterized protein n=1 Tax=Trichinella patagoniensis TaxID=990121 RepID=A0A0V1A2C7_9BILA|nr:hypothetical protein T12_1035 [Trichinella patagoniensis]